MLSYEQWDSIADAVLPTLATLTVVVALFSKPAPHVQKSRWWIALFVTVGIMYAGRAVTHSQAFMTSVPGFLYSSHTGLFVSLGIALSHWKKRFAIPLLVWFILYAGLMIFQRYHTLLDIAVTGIVVGAVAMTAFSSITKKQTEPQ